LTVPTRKGEREDMPFEHILGQERPKRFILAALRRNRLGHAYLFSGPDGVGKTLFAIELAKLLFCRGEGDTSCDQCPDCRMVEHRRHPDLNVVAAEGASRVIKIAQAREVSRMLRLMPVQAARRLVILREADRMEEPAANALLKTLEEPAHFAHLILTTSRPRNLLPTIRSRCQELRFGPLSAEQISCILSRRRGPAAEDVSSAEPRYSDEEIRFAARFAGGAAGAAIQVIESACMEVYDEVLRRTRQLPEGDLFELSDAVLDWAASVSTKLEPQRRRLRELLRLLSYAYRDLLVSGVDDASAPAAKSNQVRIRRLFRIIEAIWDARRQTDANAAMKLVLDNLFARIAELQAA